MTAKLIAALAAALPKVEGATKDKNNPHFKSKYADLSSVIDAIRPVAEHGLWFRQEPVEHGEGACIRTVYVHTSGEELSAGECFVPASKRDAQGFGSAMTYARRYGLLAAFGIAPEDDDGNAAVSSYSAPKRQPEPRETASPPKRFDGPYPTATSLHKALTEMERELRSCGDGDMLAAFLQTAEWNDFVAACEARAPHYLDGGDPAPPEFLGLRVIADRMKQDFANIEAMKEPAE